MATDDLTAPLGQDKAQSKRWVVPAVVPWSIAASLGSGLAVYLGWAAFVNDPYGGEPVVVVPVTVPHVGTKEAAAGARPTASAAVPVPAAAPSSAIATTAAGAQQAPVDGSRTVTIIDGSSGQRKEVPIGAPAAAKSAPVGDQKSEAPGGVKPAPLAGDPRLLESTRHGEIPRVGTDGVRALDVYARRQASRSDVPRIAIVVSGLGIGTAATAEALAKLPGPVTYALAPYAADVDRLAARARAQGHELLLQVPMEPLDFPDNDPGPQTLLTSLTPEQNLDRLYWLMSRFRGYVGIANFMGARFTATDAAVAPILRETAKRGLLYFDDRSSARSVVSQVAGANRMAFARADVVLDAVPTPAEVDRALARLEKVARERGVAIGVTGALPVTIDHIAAWAKAVESRGFSLVPLTATVAKPKST